MRPQRSLSDGIRRLQLRNPGLNRVRTPRCTPRPSRSAEPPPSGPPSPRSAPEYHGRILHSPAPPPRSPRPPARSPQEEARSLRPTLVSKDALAPCAAQSGPERRTGASGALTLIEKCPSTASPIVSSAVLGTAATIPRPRSTPIDPPSPRSADEYHGRIAGSPAGSPDRPEGGSPRRTDGWLPLCVRARPISPHTKS